MNIQYCFLFILALTEHTITLIHFLCYTKMIRFGKWGIFMIRLYWYRVCGACFSVFLISYSRNPRYYVIYLRICVGSSTLFHNHIPPVYYVYFSPCSLLFKAKVFFPINDYYFKDEEINCSKLSSISATFSSQ